MDLALHVKVSDAANRTCILVHNTSSILLTLSCHLLYNLLPTFSSLAPEGSIGCHSCSLRAGSLWLEIYLLLQVLSQVVPWALVISWWLRDSTSTTLSTFRATVIRLLYLINGEVLDIKSVIDDRLLSFVLLLSCNRLHLLGPLEGLNRPKCSRHSIGWIEAILPFLMLTYVLNDALDTRGIDQVVEVGLGVIRLNNWRFFRESRLNYSDSNWRLLFFWKLL